MNPTLSRLYSCHPNGSTLTAALVFEVCHLVTKFPHHLNALSFYRNKF